MPSWLYDVLVSIGGALPWSVLAGWLLIEWRKQANDLCEESIKVQSAPVDLAEKQTVTALVPAMEVLLSEFARAHEELGVPRNKLSTAAESPVSHQACLIRDRLFRLVADQGVQINFVTDYARVVKEYAANSESDLDILAKFLLEGRKYVRVA